MTGDVNLTHIRVVLDEYEQAANLLWQARRLESALAQLAAAEAVIQAARDVADKSPALMSDTPFAHALNQLHRHLAALEDGQ